MVVLGVALEWRHSDDDDESANNFAGHRAGTQEGQEADERKTCSGIAPER